MDRHLRSVAITTEVISRSTECTQFNLDYSRMSAVVLQKQIAKSIVSCDILLHHKQIKVFVMW